MLMYFYLPSQTHLRLYVLYVYLVKKKASFKKNGDYTSTRSRNSTGKDALAANTYHV